MRTAAAPAPLLDLLRARYGLEFPRHRWDLVVEAAALVTGAPTVGAAAAALERDLDLRDALLERLTVGETYFFREPEQFQALTTHAVPDLRRRRPDGDVRAWSAGCASGEEAYSMAMALRAAGLARARVLATDLSPAALALTRAATYGPWSLRGVGARRALPYLEARGRTWVVDPSVRGMVEVERLNLAADPYPRDLDLVFCRNVLIYLDRATVARVARGLFDALAPGGWLFVASTDPPLARLAPFDEVVTSAGRVYRRPVRRRAQPDDPAPTRRGAARRLRSTVPTPGRPRPPGAAPPRAHLAAPRPPSPPSARPRDAAHDDPGAVRALAAAGDLDRALLRADGLLRRDPLAADLHLLRGLVLLSLGRPADAAGSLRRAVYLAPDLAMGHFSLGIALERAGSRSEARRAYAAAARACAAGGPGEALPHGDGATADDVGRAAAARVAALEAARRGDAP
ncbi:MAG: protein-glutamate O-methyltransferase CheR [Planctomycetes bacterium]|nr:protein-glutamate O-methyltransferase CheR [Planctomycetota bacterium]